MVRNKRGQKVADYEAMVSPGMLAVLTRVIARAEEQVSCASGSEAAAAR